MDGQSLTPQQVKIQQIKQILPEAFSEGKIDWEKLKATLGEDVTFNNERYVLNWAGKSDAFRVLQTPSSKTLAPAKEESVNFEETENIFIEGENLEVLKVLQKSYFGTVKMIYIDPPYNTGNDSFIYPDKFSETKDEYQRRVGDKDEEGYMTKDGMFRKNSKENGQYHSNWLNMMMPRMYLAKNLLRDDGVIFVSIDDNEVHNLRLLMNEIFGEENFVANISWHKNYASSNDVKTFSNVLDCILVYQKSDSFQRRLLPRTEKQDSLYKYDTNDGMGLWRSDNLTVKSYSANYDYPITNPKTGVDYLPTNGRCWMTNKETILKWIDEKRVFFGQNDNGAPQLKRYLNEVQQGVVPITYWSYDECGHNDEARKEIKNLFEKPPFDTPKPTRLIKRILTISCSENDFILDFFSGSGTTAHAVMDLNKEDGGHRKYICVQLPELCDEKSEAYKAGYQTIADIAKERIRRAANVIGGEIQSKIQDLQSKILELKAQLPTDETLEQIKNLKSQIKNLQSQDTGFKVLKLSDSNFKQWQQITGNDAATLEAQMKLFVDPVAENAIVENMVYELLLKSGKDLNSLIEYKLPSTASNHVEAGSPSDGFPSFGGVAVGRGGFKLAEGRDNLTSFGGVAVGRGGLNVAEGHDGFGEAEGRGGFYIINRNELIFLLEKADQEIVDEVLRANPKKVIALDRLFTGNDQLKTNTYLQMKDAGVEFKTI